MNEKIVVLIIFIAVFIVLLLILAILAFFQQRRINEFLRLKKLYQQEIEEFKTMCLPIELNEIASGWQMPKYEICYLKTQVEVIPYKFAKKKEQQQYLQLLGKKQENYQFNIVRKTFNFKLLKNKTRYKALLYITNKRLVISNKTESKLWDLTAIDKVEFSVFNLNNSYYKGIIIYLNNAIFHVITDNLKIAFMIQQLIS